MPDITITEAARLTKRDPRTVKKVADGLPCRPGPKNSELYESSDLFERIYLGTPDENGNRISYSDAIRRLTLRKDAEIELNMEIKRKERIPRDLVITIFDEAQQSTAAILKSCKGKRMDEPKINEILEKFREMPSQLPSAIAAD